MSNTGNLSVAPALDVVSAELAKVPKSDAAVVWNATAQTTIQTKAAAALTAHVVPTVAQMDAAHALLATPAQVLAQAASALGTYDAPTKAEMDAAFLAQYFGVMGVTPNDTLIESHDAVTSGVFAAYTVTKRLRFYCGGYFRIKFDIKTGNAGFAYFGKLYKNDVAFGTERTGVQIAYVTYTEDLFVAFQDEVELYIYTAFEGAATSTQNLRVYGLYDNNFAVIL